MTDALIIFAARDAYLLSVLIFIWCAYRAPDRRVFFATALVVCVVAFVLSRSAAGLYDNPRPFMLSGVPPLVYHEPGNGFPSDHALLSSTLAAAVSMSNPYLGTLAWLVAVVVGAGRVLAGVHHTIDVLASFLLALMGALVARYAVARLLAYFPRP